MFKKLALLVFLSGCTSVVSTGNAPQGVARSNAVMAQEFIDLTFMTETGSPVRGLLKYTMPIGVSLDPSLSEYRSDLEEVLRNIRRGANIDIALTGGSAQISIQQISGEVMNRNFPTAACVVASGVSNWAAFRRGGSVRWSGQTKLVKAAIFIPDDAPPYVVRACINEELGQALGPVNDLYGVADTIFNDDNVHSRLTGFDLLMLRVLYDDRLQLGMSKAQALPIVQDILARINPQGDRAGIRRIESPQWKQAIETAMTGTNPRGTRVAAARQAIAIARNFGDHRLVHSLLVFGRLNLSGAPQLAAPAFEEAYRLSLSQLGPNNLRTAVAAMHIAAIALAAQRFDEALSLTNAALVTARAHKDAVLISGIQGIRALAFGALGREAEAARARLDSQEQALYAFGNDVERIASAQAQIAGLVPAEN